MSIYGQSAGLDTGVSISGGTTDTMNAQRLLRNAALVSRAFPQFVDDPASLLSVAGVNMDSGTLADQIGTLSSTRIASNDVTWLNGLSKAGQRVAWTQMSQAQQQGYSALGYSPPESGGQKTSNSIFGDVVQGVGGAFGAAWNGIDTAVHDVGAPLMEGLQTIGQIPTEMYRAIRTQPEWIQALAGAVGVGAAVALTAATGGADIPLLGELGAGAAAEGGFGIGSTALGGLTAAYTTAGIVNTMNGNGAFWGHTFDQAWTRGGEGIFENGALDRATKLLADDGQANQLAQSLALTPQADHGDESPVSRLVREFASRRDATSDDARLAAVQELAMKYAGGDPSTQQYQDAYTALEALSREPRFMEALTTLQQAKVSPGRDLANTLHLPHDSSAYSMISGAGDAAFQFALDPILAAGKVLSAQRALRFSVMATDTLDQASYNTRIDTLFGNSSVNRAWTKIAQHMGDSTGAQMIAEMPGTTMLYNPLKMWGEQEKVAMALEGKEFQWSPEAVRDFFKDQEGIKALTSGRSVAGGADNLLMVPHLTPVQSAALRLRSDVRSVISALDDANLSFRWDLPGSLGPDYDLATHIGSVGMAGPPQMTWGAGLAYKVLDGVPVLNKVSESAGSFLNTLLTKLPTSDTLLLDTSKLTSKAVESPENLMAFVDNSRFVGMPSWMRTEWKNVLLEAESGGARRQAIRSFYNTIFDEMGVNATPEGKLMTERFLGQEGKAYSLGRDVGTNLYESADHLLVPSARDMRLAANQQTVLNKFLHLTDANFIDTAVNKIWKPSVLMRIGFIGRAFGDEMLSWLGRGGIYQQIAGSMARSVNDGTDLVGHVRLLGGFERGLYGLADRGAERFLGHGLPDLEQGLLKRYSSMVRGVYRNGILGGYLDNDTIMARYGRQLLAPEGKLRSLVFNGVPQGMLNAGQEWFANPIVRAGIMGHLSSMGHSNPLGVADGMSDQAVMQALDAMDPAMLDRMPMSTYWRKADPLADGYDTAAYRGQLQMINGADGIYNDKLLSTAQVGRVDDKLERALNDGGISFDTLRQLGDNVQATTPEVKQLVQTMLATDDTKAVGAALNNVQWKEDDPVTKFLTTRGSQYLSDEQDVRQWLGRIVSDVEAPPEIKQAAQIALILHNQEGTAAQRWLATWLDHPGAELNTAWTEADATGQTGDALRQQLVNDPKAMHIWHNMEDSTTTAETGRRVARPARAGTSKWYLPAPTSAGTEVLTKLAAADPEMLRTLAEKADPATAEVIMRIAQRFQGYPDHVRDMIGQTLSQPLWHAFKDPEQAMKITHVLNDLGGIERHDLVATAAELTLPERLMNRNIVKGEWPDYHAITLDPETVQASHFIHPNEGLQSIHGEQIPGASEAEALDEHLHIKTAAFNERYHSPTNRTRNPSEYADPVTKLQPWEAPATANLSNFTSVPNSGGSTMAIDGKLINTAHVPETLHTDGGDPFIVMGPGHDSGVDAVFDPYAAQQDYEAGGAYLRGHLSGSQPVSGPLARQLEQHPIPSPDSIMFKPWVRADTPDEVMAQLAEKDPHGLAIVGNDRLAKEYGSLTHDADGYARDPSTVSHIVITKPTDAKELGKLGDNVRVAYLAPPAENDVWLRIHLEQQGVEVRDIKPSATYDAATHRLDDMHMVTDPTTQEAYFDDAGQLHAPVGGYGEGDQVQWRGDLPHNAETMTPDEIERYMVARAAAHQLAGLPISDNSRLVASTYGDHAARAMTGTGALPSLSPQVAQHLAESGIDPDQLMTHLADNGGANAYSELLQRHVAHLAAGDDPGTAMDKALRGIGYPMADETDQALRSRVLWETVGPMYLDRRAAIEGRSLYDHDEGKVIQLSSLDHARDIPREDLPRGVVEQLPKDVAPPTYWDKIVKFGFGRVIGPFLDKIVRTPMAFANYAAAYEDALPTYKWLRAPEYFAEAADTRKVETVTSDLIRPWSQGERFRIAGISSSPGATEEGQAALRLSHGEPWFDAYGQPSRWLQSNLDALDRNLPVDSELRDIISNVKVTHEETTFEHYVGEGKLRAAVREEHEKLTQFKMSYRDKADISQALQQMDLLAPNEDVSLGLARLRAAPQDALDRMDQLRTAGSQAQFGKLDQWLHSPPPTVDDALEELISLGHKGDMPAWAADRFATGSGRNLLDAGLASDRQATRTVVDNAMHRAIVDTTPYIARSEVKSQFDEYVHNLVPFWFAQEQWARRIGRTLLMHPEALRAAQLTYQGLKSGGVIRTDQFGNDIFVYPGSTVAAEMIGKLPFFDDKLPIASAMTGQVNYSLPGLDRFGVPSVSPLVAIPMAQIANIFPEMQPAQAALAGNRGAGSGIIRALVPSSVMRFYDAIMSNDGDRRLSSAMKTAAEVLEANGNGLPDNADTYTQEHYLDRLKNTARTILMTQAFFGFVGPASPDYQMVGVQGKPGQSGGAWDLPGLLGVNTPDALLNDEYVKLVQNMGAEEGTKAFLARYPDNSPGDLFNQNIAYKVGQSTSTSGAPLPPTKVAEQFLSANYQWAKENPLAAGWLIPPAQNSKEAAERDINTWTDQMAIGLRQTKSPEDMIKDLKFAVGSETYFDTRQQFQDQIDASTNKADQLDLKTQMQLWTTAYLSTHPIFAADLASGAGRERRSETLQQLRLAFADPSAPKPWHAAALQSMVENMDQFQMQVASLAGSSSMASQRKKAGYTKLFENWAEDWVTQHPELKTFWLGVIKPEAGLT